ncbi:MAG: zinc ribbon domain-containing protein [Betaproteobacteria bacterium]|jgi:putative FmdB family regulatory protein|nr:zinc ribbon domain-containing protein [Betaproteobacteria bacterium]
MPTYVYAPTAGHCPQCERGFEVFQRMAEERLTACPACGQPCERRISAVALGGKYSTSNDKVKQLGLTKYQKAGDGVYERVVGNEGPEHIFR